MFKMFSITGTALCGLVLVFSSGAKTPAGLPLELFTTGAARWLAVEPGVPAAINLSRILLVGVPYALKAVDADTLGGKPGATDAFVFMPASPAAG